MSLKATVNTTPRQAPMEIGNYPARVVQVIDLGLQPQQYRGETKPPARELNVTYEFPLELCVDGEGNELEDKPRWLSESFVLYNRTADRSKAAQRMCSIDPSNQLEDDWGRVLGMPLSITVVHNVVQGKEGKITYANIGSTAPLMKGMEIPELINPSVVFDLDEPDLEVFMKQPDWLKDKIKSNLEFKGSALEALLEGHSKTEGEPAPSEEDNPY